MGDAVQFLANTTSNSVVVTTTNQLSNADIGKAIEVFGAGTLTTPTNGQDMIATITNVVNGTNIYISQPAQATLTNTFATYGHDNSSNFQAAVYACGTDTNDIIYVPAGQFLLLADNPAGGSYGENSILVTNGGIHLFGAGTNNTTLLGQGAWTLVGGAANRGIILVLHPPMINDNFSIGNMTLDGGVQYGWTTNNGYPASTITGMGWDGTHHAIQIGGIGNITTHLQFTNIVFQHWRGEILESVDGSTNGNLNIFNCIFNDGNATAINIYPSLNISNCVFSGLFQVGEYYQAYSTNTSYFQDNLVTNITGNGFAFNGAVTNHAIPSFNIVSNTFYFSSGNGIETTPGQNIYITGNQFFNGTSTIALGCAGYQGTAINSNIVVTANIFSNCYYAIEVEGGGRNLVADVIVNNNTAYNAYSFACGYGWSTNVYFYNNVLINGHRGLDSSILFGQWYQDDISNQFPIYNQIDDTGVTNTVSYASYGIRHQIIANAANSLWALDDTHPSQVPPGAVLQITSAGSYPASVYTSASMSKSPLVLATGQTINFCWTNGVWAAVITNAIPPLVNNFHIAAP